MPYPIPPKGKVPVNLYEDPLNPSPFEVEIDLEYEDLAMNKSGPLAVLAAYILGAREACLSLTTNLDDAIDGDVMEWYEAGRAHYMPEDS